APPCGGARSRVKKAAAILAEGGGRNAAAGDRAGDRGQAEVRDRVAQRRTDVRGPAGGPQRRKSYSIEGRFRAPISITVTAAAPSASSSNVPELRATRAFRSSSMAEPFAASVPELFSQDAAAVKNFLRT